MSGENTPMKQQRHPLSAPIQHERSPLPLAQQLNLLASDQATVPIPPCSRCSSTKIHVVPMPASSPHYAKRVCACNAFRGWEPNPQSKERQQQQQIRIAVLLKSPQLSEWERTFLEGLKGKKVSPRQQEILNRIEVKVGGLA